jgi:hypothetical protein
MKFSRFKLAVLVSNAVMAWYVHAAEDKKIDPDEVAALLWDIAKILGVDHKLHIGVDPVE